MTNYAADGVGSTVGTITTKRTGTTASDTVPVGSLVVWVNTGVGTHNVTLTNSQTQDGLTVGNRVIQILTGNAKAAIINPLWGDANGNVAVGIDGTAAEVTYYVLGGF